MYIDRNTAATRERTYERPDPVSLTEQAGYIPPQDQIESMILAGQRLNEARASQYDFASEDDIDEDASDLLVGVILILLMRLKWLWRLKCL